MNMRNDGLSLIGKALLCGTFVFNFWVSGAHNAADHMKHVGLTKDANRLYYPCANTVFRMQDGRIEEKLELTTKNGKSLYDSFNNCAAIFEKAWENRKQQQFTEWISAQSFERCKSDIQACQNGLVLSYLAWSYFHNISVSAGFDSSNEGINRAIKDLKKESYLAQDLDTEILAHDVNWYLNSKKWKGADWVLAISIDRGAEKTKAKTGNRIKEIRRVRTKNTETTMDRYSMMITSKYFNSINDYINIEKCCKEYNGIIEQFHYNPISLKNEKERELFKNIETWHFYTKDEVNKEKKFIEKDTRIKKIVDWGEEISYSVWKEDKKGNRAFTNVKYDKKDMIKYLFYQEKNYELFLKEENVELEEGITSIGDYCFSLCSNLNSITIPTTVSSIESHCFACCSNLKTINIPTSVKSIGSYCFSCCDDLTSITIPSSVTFIGNNCFNNCNKLTDIKIVTRRQ